MTTKEIMDQLAVELKKSKPNQRRIDQLNKELDKALGTELPEENAALARAWENGRRR